MQNRRIFAICKEQTGNSEHGGSATSLFRLSVHIYLPVCTLPTSKKFRSVSQRGVGGEGYTLRDFGVMITHSLLGANCFLTPSGLNTDCTLCHTLQLRWAFLQQGDGAFVGQHNSAGPHLAPPGNKHFRGSLEISRSGAHQDTEMSEARCCNTGLGTNSASLWKQPQFKQ